MTKIRSHKDKPQSPYAKYGKRPYRYSDTYRAWREAVRKQNFEAAARLSEEHRRQFGPASEVA